MRICRNEPLRGTRLTLGERHIVFGQEVLVRGQVEMVDGETRQQEGKESLKRGKRARFDGGKGGRGKKRAWHGVPS